MQEIIRFALLGLGLGSLYSLASQGLIVIYRGSGVLNFAHGAIGMVGAYIEWEVKNEYGKPIWFAWLCGLLACAIIGALTHLLIMRRLRRASPLARIVATLGVLIVLQAGAVLRYGSKITFVKSELPVTVLEPFGIIFSVDRLVLVGIAAVLSLGLWILYRYTKFGIATTAVAENQRAASAVGLSPDWIATANWALGSSLAGLAAILIAPIVQLQVATMTNLVLAALATALVASFRSFPVAFAAGMLIGIGQTELTRYVHTPGISSSLPFAVIIIWMLLRGAALPLRDYFLQRLPAVGTGRVHPIAIAVAVAVTCLIIVSVPIEWQDAFVTTFAMGFVLLSVVVITGYAGQLSLGQFALAGFGAWVAGRLVDAGGWPFWAALLAGAVATIPIGALFALPAVRARGINLAIVTLGMGTAMELMIFNNGDFVGGFAGTRIGKPDLFGWDINAISHPGRYAIVCMFLFVAVALMVASMRRGRSGRRLLAVRTNERAAAALGISVPGAKIYAFAVSAGIAALGGTLLAFRKDVILYGSEFTNFTSILVVAWSFIGGIGFLLGPIFGSTLAPGSLGAQLTNQIFSSVTQYIQLIGGVFVIMLVLQNQDGIAKESINQIAWIGGKIQAKIPKLPRTKPKVFELPPEERDTVTPRTLEVQGLRVRYGGVVAVNEVSFTVSPGRIVGLIGPNGAGKTSVIDAVTGFTRASGGSVKLDGRELLGLTATKRARAGLSRSFQSLELFEDASVLDNLRAASDPWDRLSYVRDLVHPVAPQLPGQVVAAIREFHLEDDLMRQVQDLPYGQRRLLAIARAVATQPSILLLDEPAAGLSDVETAELAHLVRRLAVDWGIAVLLIEHDMTFVMSVCDHIVVLDFGTQISEGSPQEVRDPAVIAAYLGESEEEVAATLAPVTGGDASTPTDFTGTENGTPGSSNGAAVTTAVLEARGVSAGYGPQPVIHEINLEVEPGEVVGLLGANGAGKTTTLLTLAGELPLLTGEVLLGGVATTAALHKRARQGLMFVTEEKSVFMGLTARDNLRVAEVDLDDALALFPELERLLGVRAGLLSGGEQQMLTVARALSRKPKVLLADELSMGLAPLVVKRLLDAVVRAAKQQGTAVLLVEQHVRKALEYCDRAYVMHRGRIELTGSATELLGRLGEIEDRYLAVATGVDKSGLPPD